MQDENFYKRLGACMNLAIAGATDGERSSGKAAVKRMMTKLTAAELAILASGFPDTKSRPTITKPPKTGSKAAEILVLLRQGFTPKDVSERLHVRIQYVYNIRKRYQE